MQGVAQGLHTLHEADIVHGALHQNNVFAVNRERGVVGDFDFTKSVVKCHDVTSGFETSFNIIRQYFSTCTRYGNLLQNLQFRVCHVV